MVYARQDMAVRHQRWVNGHLDRRKTCLALRSRLNLFHDAEQLDRVAKLPGEFQIERFDEANAFDVNIFRIHPKAMRERSQNSDLVHRVGPIDIQRRLCFGIAEPLRVREHILELRAFELHAREDVITGAVDDPVKVRDAIADEPFPERLDNRDTTRNARFVVEVGSILLGRFEQLFAVGREQRFIGGDHRLAQFQSRENYFTGRGRAADQFNHQIDVRIVNDAVPVSSEQ